MSEYHPPYMQESRVICATWYVCLRNCGEVNDSGEGTVCYSYRRACKELSGRTLKTAKKTTATDVM